MTPDLGDIPTRGLLEALSSWALAGGMTSVQALRAAVGSLQTLDADNDWSPRDIRRRATRMAWEHLRPIVMMLPDSSEEWMDALPAVGVTHAMWSDTPQYPVDWAASVRRMGVWPPPASRQPTYLTRRRSKERHEPIVSAIAWGRTQFLATLAEAESLGAIASRDARDRIEALPAVAAPVPPNFAEVEALRLLGKPFAELSAAILTILTLERDPFTYARDLLLPDNEFRWRLFHLGCYGEILAEAVDRVGPIASTRPLVAGTQRPTHVLRDGVKTDVTYEFWFEASGLWRLRPGPTPHEEVAKAVHGTRGGLIPDICVIRRRDDVIERLALAEVKYSRNGQYIFGSGYPEALGYGLAAVGHFGVDTLSLVTAPNEMVAGDGASVQQSISGCQLQTGVGTPATVARLFIDWITSPENR